MKRVLCSIPKYVQSWFDLWTLISILFYHRMEMTGNPSDGSRHLQRWLSIRERDARNRKSYLILTVLLFQIQGFIFVWYLAHKQWRTGFKIPIAQISQHNYECYFINIHESLISKTGKFQKCSAYSGQNERSIGQTCWRDILYNSIYNYIYI